MADTRRQILITIREQIQLLKDLGGPLDKASSQHRWTPQQWWESFTFLFVNTPSNLPHEHQDDLLFFVRHQPQSGISPQVFVRRKGKQLPEDLQLTGKDFSNVDWPQTVLLNLVLHSHYQLTVVACGPEALPFVAEGRTWSPGMIAVTRPVYASTTVTAVNLDSSRAKDSNPQPCYPDCCFAVDNFDNTFEDLVLEDVSRCYCVVLHALLDMHESAASPPAESADLTDVVAHFSRQTQLQSNDSSSSPGQPQQQAKHMSHPQPPSSNGSTSTSTAARAAAPADSDAPVTAPVRHHSSTDDSGSGAWQIGTHKRTLFAAYVSFQQIVDFMAGSSRNGRSLLDSLLKTPKAPLKDKVIMTGPGGMGRCEVVVTKLEAPAAPPSSGSSTSSRGQGHHQQQPGAAVDQQQGAPATGGDQQRSGGGLLQRGLQRARFVASGVQQALDVLSELQPSEGGASTMLCALMTLRLPVHYVAQELLAAV